MKSAARAFLILLFSGIIIGTTGVPAFAEPPVSQHLRGMAGRTFVVDVSVLGGPFLFQNCYTFNADGTWFDLVLDRLPVFKGALGEWEQASNGTRTSYEVKVDLSDFGVDGVLRQEGVITPSMGRGVLQLSAQTVIPAGVVGGELTVVSVGSEVDSCPL